MIRQSRSGPDLMILGADNIDVQHQQIRVAKACQASGLSVQFLAEDLSAPRGKMAAPYRLAGFDVSELPCKTWRTGPLAYPSAPAQIRLLIYWRHALNCARPRLVLTHADRGGTWGIIQALAKKSGVTGVVMQEGVSAEARGRSMPRPAALWRRAGSRALRALWRGMLDNPSTNYSYADHALVWGETMRRQLVAAGRPPATAHVVGSPQFDHVRALKPLADQSLRTVLFAHQPQPNEAVEREACLHLIRACADDLKCRLLFRPHPRGTTTRGAILEMAASTTAPGLVEVADGPDIGAYLPDASVLATYYSASAYHAALQGLPLLLLDWVSPLYHLNAPAYHAALSVKEPAALAPSLRQILDDVELRAFLHDGMKSWLIDHLGPLDGRSSHRAAAALGRLADAAH